MGLLARLATVNSIAVIDLMRHIAVVPTKSDRWRDCDLNLLAKINLATCIAITPEELAAVLQQRFVRGDSRMPRLHARPHPRPWLTWEQRSCTRCLSERDMAFRTEWLRPQAFMCRDHAVAMVGSRMRDAGHNLGLVQAQVELDHLVRGSDFNAVANAFEIAAEQIVANVIRSCMREVIENRLKSMAGSRQIFVAVDVAIAALPEIVHNTSMLVARR